MSEFSQRALSVEPPANVAAIVLAAGLGARYRAQDANIVTKLIARLDGKPLVRHVAEAALASHAKPLLVVTGHEQGAVREALAGLAIIFVHNPDFASGLASSLQAGVAALPSDTPGALILLGDMPRVSAATLNRSIALFEANPHCAAVAPVYRGARGNPVLLARRMFAPVAQLTGDQGARPLLRSGADVIEWEADDAAIEIDVDTPEGLSKLS